MPTAESWIRAIGKTAWEHVLGDEDPVAVAEILARAVEVGFTAPAVRPVVTAGGRRVLWAGPSGTVPVLTAQGLLGHWEGRRHRFLILRVGPLLRAVAGLSLPRLQEIMLAYEDQCSQEGVELLPVDFAGFVGGHRDHIDPQALWSALCQGLPPRRHVTRATAGTTKG